MNGIRIWLLLLGFAAGMAQAQDEALARGSELLAPFKQELQSALRAGMADGPRAAIDVCHLQAPAIADGLMQDGIRLGRSSHRLRNPANKAPDWVRPLLRGFVDDESNRAAQAVELSKGRWGYVEPIVTQPLCLTCHGESLPPEIATRIEDLYPDDEATGFEAGDLRGVFWLEFPAER